MSEITTYCFVGSYTVRTETTVRTTELNFTLGVPFKEETLDGRITDTTATRVGNILTLDQKGMSDDSLFLSYVVCT